MSEPQLEQVPASIGQIREALREPNLGNDHSAFYIHTGVLPQAHIQNAEDPFLGYPKLQKLHELKTAHNQIHARPIVGAQIEPTEMAAVFKSWAKSAANFDVVMVGGCYPGFNTGLLLSLPVASITPRPSLLFLWCPSSKLTKARQVMEHWGFRRSEDIVYLVRDESSVHMPKLPSNQILKSSTWHCLMGLKGTLRRSDDGDLINCNVDIDVIVEKPGSRSSIVPEEIYEVVENFTMMGRRLHIVPFRSPEPLPVRLRPGWVIASPDVLMSNFRAQHFRNRFLIPVDPEIDALRPRTPPSVERGSRLSARHGRNESRESREPRRNEDS